jgi:hypothetical protein
MRFIKSFPFGKAINHKGPQKILRDSQSKNRKGNMGKKYKKLKFCWPIN